MNYTFVPDLVALAMLIVILLLVRREHSEERANAWLLGLFITLVEGIAHTFYAPQGMPAAILHIVVIDSYMLAGMVFIWASSDSAGSSGHRRIRSPAYLRSSLPRPLHSSHSNPSSAITPDAKTIGR